MLPESYLCGKETENIRRLLKSRERIVRSTVGQMNEDFDFTKAFFNSLEKFADHSKNDLPFMYGEDIDFNVD